jgi:transmembrane sensor
MKSKEVMQEIIIRYFDKGLGEGETQELLSWINESKENEKYVAEIKDLWDASVEDARIIADTENEWRRFRETVGSTQEIKTKRVVKMRTFWPAIAAVLLVGLVFSSIVIFSVRQDTACFTAVAPKGSITKMIMPDNSVIYLNAGSEIRYSQSKLKTQRDVFLSGEAYFDVTKNKRKPFVVHTDYYDVKVMGTKFNVKTYSDDNSIETTLEKGSVLVTSNQNISLPQDFYLKPGEQLAYNREENTIGIKKVDPQLYVSWKDNHLRFINMDLDELFKLMERKYGVEIEIEDDAILDYHYSGTIKNESILELLEIIQYTTPIHYEIEGQKVLISKK